jgi:hypothetical protein
MASGAPAAQPRSVYARLLAAETATPSQAAALLRSALLTAPDALSDIIRLRLFQAEVASAHFEAAHFAIEPVLDAHSYLRFAPIEEADGSAVGDTDYDLAGIETAAARTPDAANLLDPFTVDAALPDEASHRAFLLSLADVDQRCGDEASALQELEVSLKMHPPSAESVQLKNRITSLRNALDLAAENARRRPVIQASVVQTVVVRPRLRTRPEVRP